MTDKYDSFQRFFFSLISREAEARQERDIITGNLKHYTVKVNSFEKLQRLALDVVNDTEHVEEVTELQRAAVAFVVRVNRGIFVQFLNCLNGRFMVANRFYPQCIEEYTYKRRDWLPVSQWVAELFTVAEEAETAESSESVTTSESSETSESVTTETTETETTETETRPAPALYMRPSGLSIFVNFDEEPGEPAEETTEPTEPTETTAEETTETAGGVTPEDMERAYTRLLDALRARDGSHLLIIRPDDEPLSVDIDALLALGSLSSQVAHIAEENEIDPGEVVRLLASAPLSYDDGDEDDGNGDEDDGDDGDGDGDGDEDDGEPWGDDRDGDDGSGYGDDEDDEEPGGGFYPLTWTEILTDPRLNGWGAHDEYLAHDDFLAHDEYLAHDGY